MSRNIPPLPHTSSKCGAWLSTGIILPHFIWCIHYQQYENWDFHSDEDSKWGGGDLVVYDTV